LGDSPTSTCRGGYALLEAVQQRTPVVVQPGEGAGQNTAAPNPLGIRVLPLSHDGTWTFFGGYPSVPTAFGVQDRISQ
jgi:hypothetical protein